MNDPEWQAAYNVGAGDTKAAIVAYLRSGGDTVRGVFYAWDSEMRGYYSSVADRIEGMA